MRKKYAPEHVMIRDGVYYYVRHIPYDLAPIYSVTRLCFSLKTKSLKPTYPYRYQYRVSDTYRYLYKYIIY